MCAYLPHHYRKCSNNFAGDCVVFKAKHFLIGRLEERDQHPGLRVLGINPLDFFFRCYIKERVFTTPIADFEELKARLQPAVCIVTEVM